MFKHPFAPSTIDKTISENKEIFEIVKARAEKALAVNVAEIKSYIDKKGYIERPVLGGYLIAVKTKDSYCVYYTTEKGYKFTNGSIAERGREFYVEADVEKAIKSFIHRMNSSRPELPTPNEVFEQPLFNQTLEEVIATSKVADTSGLTGDTVVENKETFSTTKATGISSFNIGIIRSIMDTKGVIEKSVPGGTLVAEKEENGYYVYFKSKGSDVRQGGELYIKSAIENAIKGFVYRMNSSSPELPAPNELFDKPLSSQTADEVNTISETYESKSDKSIADRLSGKDSVFTAEDIVSETTNIVKNKLLNHHTIRENVADGVLVIEGFLEKDYVMYFKKEGSEVKYGEDVFKGEDVDKLIKAFLYRVINGKPEKHSLVDCEIPEGNRIINN